jgi:polyhydroxybutyrate depolymerase
VVNNWAEGCNCNNADRLEIDDIGFTRALIDTVSTHYSIDPARIYVLGFSQGGLYVQRVACEMADQIAAVATVAATMSVPLSQSCAPADPVSMLVMHGTADTVLPYNGTSQGALSLLSAPATLNLWRGHNACPSQLKTTTERIDATRDLKHELYRACAENTQVHLYSIVGGGHTWPSGAFDANTVVTDFFASQSNSSSTR